MKSAQRFFLLSICLLAVNNFAAASSEKHDDHAEGHEEFNAGELILHHIQDAHEIHFFTIGDFHATLSLPVILYTEEGLEVFSSSNFHGEHHTTKPYTTEKGQTFVMDHEKIYYADEHGNKIMKDGEPVKPMDFSITKNVVGIFLAVFIMFLLFISIAKAYKKRAGQAPKGLQSLVEPLILFVRDEVAKPSIGHRYEAFMPFLLSIFFFIWISNMLGLIPFIGGLNVTGNIAVTMVLATLTFIITSASANRGYWMHIVAPPGVPLWLLPIMIPIEILGVFSKPIVLMLRLFANITAGHIIILSFTCLIFIFQSQMGDGVAWGVSIGSMIFSIFMNFLELLVAFLQAYVFTLLSALYFGMAVEEPEHH